MTIKRIYFIAVLFISLALSGCAGIKLVGEYDEQTDKGITALQKGMEMFFVKLESVEGDMAAPYKTTSAFYGETKVAISSLRIRADALERNSLTVRMLDRLQTNFDALAIDHKEGINKQELPLYRGGFNSQFTAILTFELAKKRGENPDPAKALAAPTPYTAKTGLNK
jgi:hypothetical protein